MKNPTNRNDYFYKTIYDLIHDYHWQVEIVKDYKDMEKVEVNKPKIYIYIDDEEYDYVTDASGYPWQERNTCNFQLYYSIITQEGESSLRTTIHEAIDVIEKCVREASLPSTYTHSDDGSDLYIVSITAIILESNFKAIGEDRAELAISGKINYILNYKGE